MWANSLTCGRNRSTVGEIAHVWAKSLTCGRNRSPVGEIAHVWAKSLTCGRNRSLVGEIAHLWAKLPRLVNTNLYILLFSACQTGGSLVSENQLIAFPPWNLHGVSGNTVSLASIGACDGIESRRGERTII